MSNKIRRIAAFTAAVMLCLAPAAAYAETVSGSTPTPAAGHTSPGKEQPSHPHHSKGLKTGGHFILGETARLLEMDRRELMDSLRNGQTLYSLAKEKKGWSEDQYIQKLSEAASLKLDESLKEGQLTKEEVKKLKAGLPALLKLSISAAANSHKGNPGKPAIPVQ